MYASHPAAPTQRVRFAPTTKEGYISITPSSLPWYRQKRWKMFMLIAAVFFVGVVVGGIIGGTVASRVVNTSNQNTGTGSSTQKIPLSTVTLPMTPFGSTARSTSSESPLSSLPPQSSQAGAAVPTASGPSSPNGFS